MGFCFETQITQDSLSLTVVVAIAANEITNAQVGQTNHKTITRSVVTKRHRGAQQQQIAECKAPPTVQSFTVVESVCVCARACNFLEILCVQNDNVNLTPECNL